MNTTTKNPLDGFEKLNAYSYLYRPTPAKASTSSRSSTSSGSANGHLTKKSSDEPSLIIFCSWVGALPRHVAKYTDAYKHRFPTSPILLLFTPVGVMLLPRTRHAQLLRPAAEVIRAEMALHQPTQSNSETNSNSNNTNNTNTKTNIPPHTMHLHFSSNGGAMTTNALAAALSHPLPVRTAIFDCAPGTATVRSMADGIFASLPPRWQSRGGWLLWTALWFSFGVLSALRALLRRGNVAQVARQRLNSGAVIPASASRCYVYAVQDPLVRWRDVEAHAREAEDRELARWVRRERFEEGRHVALAAADARRYWGVVVRAWVDAGEGGGGCSG